MDLCAACAASPEGGYAGGASGEAVPPGANLSLRSVSTSFPDMQMQLMFWGLGFRLGFGGALYAHRCHVKAARSATQWHP